MTSILSACGLAFLLSTTSVPAVAIFDNLDTPNDVTTVTVAQHMYQSFVVGATPVVLSSVVLRMDDALFVDANGKFFVQLWSSTGGGTPNVSLATLTGPENPETAGDYTYSGSHALLANTTYHIVAGVSGELTESSYRWRAETPADLPTGSAHIGYGHSLDGAWTGPWTASALNMQVNGDFAPVPEPEAWAALSFAVLGLVWFVKTRRERICTPA